MKNNPIALAAVSMMALGLVLGATPATAAKMDISVGMQLEPPNLDPTGGAAAVYAAGALWPLLRAEELDDLEILSLLLAAVDRAGGILSYFTRHPTAANLLLVVLVVLKMRGAHSVSVSDKRVARLEALGVRWRAR